MKNSWMRAFKKDFNLNGVTDIYFWKSEWEKFDPHDFHDTKVSLYYFAYRFFYMAWFVGTFTATLVSHKDLDFFAIKLTNQTYTLQVIYSVLYFMYISWTLWSRCGPSKLRLNHDKDISTTSELIPSPNSELDRSTFHTDNYRLPFICKLLWIMINILNVAPYIVSGIYWLFLYGLESQDEMGTAAVMSNIFVHGLNSPLVVLDAFIMAVPIRRTHSLFAALAALYYILFSILYEVFNGRYDATNSAEYIYPMLNWRSNRGLAIGTAVGTLIGVFVIHFVMSYGTYRLRIYIKSRFSRYNTNDL